MSHLDFKREVFTGGAIGVELGVGSLIAAASRQGLSVESREHGVE